MVPYPIGLALTLKLGNGVEDKEIAHSKPLFHKIHLRVIQCNSPAVFEGFRDIMEDIWLPLSLRAQPNPVYVGSIFVSSRYALEVEILDKKFGGAGRILIVFIDDDSISRSASPLLLRKFYEGPQPLTRVSLEILGYIYAADRPGNYGSAFLGLFRYINIKSLKDAVQGGRVQDIR